MPWATSRQTFPTAATATLSWPRRRSSGRVFNARGEPIYRARVDAEPPALALIAPRWSDGRGVFRVFYETASGRTRIDVSGQAFGAASMNLDLATNGSPEFALGPVPELLTNGGFESGSLQFWTAESSVPPALPVVTADAAHTGSYRSATAYGLRLGFDSGAAGAQDRGTPDLAYSQSISTQTALPAYMNRPTLSLFYRVTKGAAEGQLFVSVEGGELLVNTLRPLTETGWTHLWLPLEAVKGERLTVKIVAEATSPGWQVDVDEVSVGDTAAGNYPVYLPATRR